MLPVTRRKVQRREPYLVLCFVGVGEYEPFQVLQVAVEGRCVHTLLAQLLWALAVWTPRIPIHKRLWDGPKRLAKLHKVRNWHRAVAPGGKVRAVDAVTPRPVAPPAVHRRGGTVLLPRPSPPGRRLGPVARRSGAYGAGEDRDLVHQVVGKGSATRGTLALPRPVPSFCPHALQLRLVLEDPVNYVPHAFLIRCVGTQPAELQSVCRRRNPSRLAPHGLRGWCR
mmetsp:Transcript_10307/g.25087  ORF Transcript_10307/g.25087 Transcript_10307/m.25087 type:complete len:225 (+) Transcript_10307:662-1336(+)